jgi:hypothetical protein
VCVCVCVCECECVESLGSRQVASPKRPKTTVVRATSMAGFVCCVCVCV